MIPCEQCGEKFYDAYDHIIHGSEWKCAKREIASLRKRITELEDKLYQTESLLYWPEKGTC